MADRHDTRHPDTGRYIPRPGNQAAAILAGIRASGGGGNTIGPVTGAAASTALVTNADNRDPAFLTQLRGQRPTGSPMASLGPPRTAPSAAPGIGLPQLPLNPATVTATRPASPTRVTGGARQSPGNTP